MEEFNGLLEEEVFPIEDYPTDDQTEVPTMPTRSVQNQAAHSALLSSDASEVVNKYRDAVAEFHNNGTSQLSSELVADANAEGAEQGAKTMVDLMADPQYSMEQKQEFVTSYADGVMNNTNVVDVLAEKALGEDSKDESAQGAATRMTWTDIMKPTNDYNKFKQKLVSDVQRKFSETSNLETTGEVLELLMPGADNKLVHGIFSEMKKTLGEKGTLVDFALVGSSRLAMQEYISSIPPEDPRRYQMAELFIRSQEKENGVYLTSNNDFMNLMNTQAVLNGDYSQTEAYVDNAFSMLGLSAWLSAGKKSFKAAKLRKMLEKAEQEAASTAVSPASVSQTLKNSNPDKARGVHAAMDADETDEAAEAAYDATKAEAISHDLAPSPASATGIVTPKLTQAAKYTSARDGEDHIVDFARNDDLLSFTNEEKAIARGKAIEKLSSPGKVRYHQEISTIESTHSGLRVNAIYGDKDGGYSSAQEAMESVANEFKDFGITPEDMVLLKRTDEGYTPALKTDTTEGDYIVKIEFDYRIDSSDIDAWTAPNIKGNLFDRIASFASAKIQRHLLNAQAYLDKVTTGSASIAIDRANNIQTHLNRMADEFIDTYKAIGKVEKSAVNKLLFEANRDGTKITYKKMKDAGLSEGTMEAVRDFRTFWDEVWKLEDFDAASTLNHRGFKVMSSQDTKLFARPEAKGSHTGKVYNNETGKVETLEQSEIDALYARGGTYARLRNALDIDGESITHVMDTGSLRKINPGRDNVLSYREGYYQTRYNGSHFVNKIVRDANGKEDYRKAVAVAGSQKEANQMLKQMADEAGVDVDTFGAIKEDSKGMSSSSDSYWDVNTAGGRTAQRFRGEQLKEAGTVDEAGLGDKYMDSPILAARSSVQSISRRVATREWLENTKQRTIATYSDLFPTDQYGRPTWTTDITKLKTQDAPTSKRAADARSMIEYVNSLENGYVDALSAKYQGLFNMFADMAGKHSSRAEKTLRGIAKVDPMTSLRQAVFTSMIVHNPLRQIVLQPMQAVRLFAINPQYMTSKQGFRETGAVLMSMGGKLSDESVAIKSGLKVSEVKELRKFITKSGIWDGVDNNNMVRSNALAMVDHESRVIRGLGHANTAVRGVGFDLGERVNVISAMLAFRNKAIKEAKGGRISDDKVYVKARAYTYSMNEADDMPYNQNALRGLMQFAQVPHKASTNWLNRNLSRKERIQSVIGDTILYGTPGYAMYNWVMGEESKLEDPVLQSALEEGFMELYINWQLEQAYGKEVDIDWNGSLAPTNMHGIAETLHLAMTGGLTAMEGAPLANFLGRTGVFLDTALEYFGTGTNYGETNLELWDVVESAMKISSGYSNYARAKLAMETGKKMNSDGTRVVDHNVNSLEAIWTGFGFQTNPEAALFTVGTDLRDSKQALKDDVREHLDTISRYLAQDGITASDVNFYSRAVRMMGNVMRERKGWEAELDKQLKFRAMEGDFTLYNNIMKDANIMTNHKMRVLAETPGLTPGQRAAILRYVDDLELISNEEK